MTLAAPERLAAGLEAVGVAADAEALARLLRWLDVHARWSRRFNLTGAREADELIDRHLVDCAAILPWLPAGRLLDVGSGAGLPGMVVALLEPRRPVILLDAQQRRTAFLEQAALEIGADNVTVVQARSEDWQSSEPLAAVLVRAVAPLPRLLPMVAAQLRGDVPLLAMKGPGWREEVKELPRDCVLVDVHEYSLPGRDRVHALLMIEQRGGG